MNTFISNYNQGMIWFLWLVTLIISQTCIATKFHHTASLSINVSAGRPMPPNLFGVFFEEINHAGAGGLWDELINNRGFEARGRDQLIPSTISPWDIIGDKNTISIAIEKSSYFKNNPMALRMDVHCDQTSCPPGGVGIYNPGYWGMNIEEGKSYKVVFYVKCSGPLEAVLSLVSPDGIQILAINHIRAEAEQVGNWTRMETVLTATGSDPIARFQFLTTQIGTIWLDQISVMPIDTYMRHGFRKDLMEMIHNLKPRFLRFPGGCYVEGEVLRNAYRWKETVGPWEERPGHLNDVWHYWSDDGLGYLEYLQLAEDLGAEPVWVINIGMSHRDEAGPALLNQFVQDMLDSIEFARGSDTTTWGSLRAKMGHPAPFSLKYVALGNENCDPPVTVRYRDHYMKFYNALKQAYPDIKAISNCDRTSGPLDHPADIYDFHRYTTVEQMLNLTHRFENMPRNNPNEPKAFVSEYAVKYPEKQIKEGKFLGALAEAAFLLSLERNSDVVEMVSYAPLLKNQNDNPGWIPDAIYFNSNKAYGISSYWVQTFFKESSGALFLNSQLLVNTTDQNIHATVIRWIDNQEKKSCITIKVVNFNNISARLKISFVGVDQNLVKVVRQTVLVTDNVQGDNSFDNPTKIVPRTRPIKSGEDGVDELVVDPYSFTAFDLTSNFTENDLSSQIETIHFR